MGRIKGHYEWNDDDLTPGQKKEGGRAGVSEVNRWRRADKRKKRAALFLDNPQVG
ncbi:hypothetical protein ACN27G_29430 [Plantactinospora sp. WMMB334]|uniref:hypothetical protein n=1 Tax=Plantactinospora sp. WMMB334 TaxID=3404119 RepID=UPI003B9553C9